MSELFFPFIRLVVLRSNVYAGFARCPIPRLIYTTMTSTVANPPFGLHPLDPVADVVLRSSDEVDFYVQRSILTLSSDFFRHTFQLPQPEQQPQAELIHVEGRILPLVEVSEHSTTIDAVLRILHPGVVFPGTKDTSLIRAVLAAADKYFMEKVKSSMQENHIRVEEHNPVVAYALACRYGLKDAAVKAAQAAS